MNSSFTKIRHFVIALAMIVLCGTSAHALTQGDIIFTGYNSRGAAASDTFTFVLLTTVSSSTPINFTDRGYNATTAAFNADNGSSETSITWTPGSVFAIGTEIRIVGLTSVLVSTGASAGTVSFITGTSGLSLAGNDQIIAYQGTIGASPTLIAGIHWNNCSSNTSSAGWDNNSCATLSAAAGSSIPPTLTDGVSAMWAGNTGGVNRVAGKFVCGTAGIPATTASAIRTAVANNANWTFTTSPTDPFSVVPGCTYYGSAAPVITGDPVASTICVNSGTSFSVTATGATSYQWQVSTTGTGGSYTNVSGANYSNATTATLTVSNAPATFNGYAYRANVTNTGGTTPSAGAVLTVNNGAPTISVNPSDAAICPNGATILSGAATSNGAITYKWQVNNGSGFTDITDGGVYSNSGTSSLSITGAPNTMYGYQYRLNATNTCGTTSSNAAALTFRSTWTGTTSTNWNVAGNWSCNFVPDTLTDVIIGTATNQPTVTTVANVRNITLNTGGTLTIAAANTISLVGTINNNGGTFNATATNATVNFNSTRANQAIPGGNYYNVQFNGSGNKVLSGDLTANGSATILTNQLVLLGNYTFTIGASGNVSANASRYFVTNGTGGLKKMGITSTSFVYPVGTTTSYTPFLVNNSGGVSDNFTGRVIDGVYTSYINDVPQGAAIASKVVNKTWFITEDVAGGSNVQMIVQWNQSDELSFNRNSCFISHYTGGSWNPVAGTVASGAAGPGPYTQTRTGITSFSPFGVGNLGSPLPLKLLTFSGSKQNEGVALSWETADEQNLAGFDVERSDDGSSFQTIGNVGARNESTEKNTYSFIDKTFAKQAATLLYRLKLVDQNGAYTYSNTIRIDPKSESTLHYQVSPNPVNGTELYIQPGNNHGGDLEISITDMTGKQWYRSTVTLSAGQGNALPVNVKTIPAGIYLLKLQNGNSIQTVKLVRN